MFLGYTLATQKFGGFDVFHNDTQDIYLFTKKIGKDYEIKSMLIGEDLDLSAISR